MSTSQAPLPGLAAGASLDDTAALLAALAPVGAAWPRDRDSNWMRFWRGCARLFVGLEDRLAALVAEAHPCSADVSAPRWRAVLGLDRLEELEDLIEQFDCRTASYPYVARALGPPGTLGAVGALPLPPDCFANDEEAALDLCMGASVAFGGLAHYVSAQDPERRPLEAMALDMGFDLRLTAESKAHDMNPGCEAPSATDDCGPDFIYHDASPGAHADYAVAGTPVASDLPCHCGPHHARAGQARVGSAIAHGPLSVLDAGYPVAQVLPGQRQVEQLRAGGRAGKPLCQPARPRLVARIQAAPAPIEARAGCLRVGQGLKATPGWRTLKRTLLRHKPAHLPLYFVNEAAL